MIITSETPVREIAVELPVTIPVLEKVGVDYCCGGQHTLAEACKQSNVALAPLLEELQRYQQGDGDAVENQWLHVPLRELTEYIVRKHHAYTREQLKLIDDLMAKVEQRHGSDHPEVFQVSKAVAVLGSELRHHAGCEEATLFPYIESLGTEQRTELPAVAKGTALVPINRMTMDHEQVGKELQTLRKLTDNYTPTSVVCSTWRGLYRAMQDLEVDLHQHIHLENNILFPRTLEQEQVEARKHASHSGLSA